MEQPIELTVNDIALMAQVVNVASQRGAFRAEEMAQVGLLYNKLTAFLDAANPQPEVDGNEPAKEKEE